MSTEPDTTDEQQRETAVRELKDKTKYLVVCICGSMRFLEQMMRTAARYTSEGYVVLMPYAVNEPQNKIALDAMHRHKIDLADFIVVVTNYRHYIGDSTRAEITYTLECGKDIRFDKYGVSESTA